MKLLTKEDILKAQDVEYKDVEVPEWGGVVRVRALSGEERDKFEASVISMKRVGKQSVTEYKQDNVRARLVAYSVVDEQGNRIFTEADIKELGKKSAKALDRVFAVAQELSGISDKDVEELAKN